MASSNAGRRGASSDKHNRRTPQVINHKKNNDTGMGLHMDMLADVVLITASLATVAALFVLVGRERKGRNDDVTDLFI